MNILLGASVTCEWVGMQKKLRCLHHRIFHNIKLLKALHCSMLPSRLCGQDRTLQHLCYHALFLADWSCQQTVRVAFRCNGTSRIRCNCWCADGHSALVHN